MRLRSRVDRIFATTLLAGLPLLAQCAMQRPALPERASGIQRATAPAPLRLELAPDPALQRLIDPRADSDAPIWLGGDVATSIEVSPDRWVWLFGDTILGQVGDGCRPGEGAPCPRPRTLVSGDEESSFVRNSAGVMWRWPDGRLSPIVKYWRTMGGRPAAIFAADAPGEFLWPLAGARVGGVLIVAASRHTLESGLRPVGNVYLRVSNPDAPPDLWSYTFHPVPNVRAGADETMPLTWTTALIEEGEHLYAFGELGVGLAARTVVSRLPIAGMDREDWKPRPEYLVREGVDGAPWTRDFALENLRAIDGLPGTSEATIERSPDLGWTSFQILPLGFDVRLYTAAALEGPWSDRGAVYRIPPPWSTTRRTDCLTSEAGCGEDRFATYAAKSHPELAPPGGFAVSYNVNLLFGTPEDTVHELRVDDRFYVPQMTAGAPAP